MRVLSLCGLLAAAHAFAPPWHRSAVPRLAAATMPSEIASAFEEVKAAAALFPADSPDAGVARDMVSRLEQASFGSWRSDDLQLLDSCLVDEGAPACEAFMAAMVTLRELHEASPGNA